MRAILASLLALFLITPAHADGEPSGEFDYYVLALSWSPTFCALEGEARDNPQCDRDLGWVLHGLWPQFESGWPQYCRSAHRNPSRSQTNDMVDIMGSSGSAWHQWKKHGVCSGLSSTDYYALARKAFSMIRKPPVLRKLDKSVTLPASLIEEAFLQSNSKLSKDMITVTCKQGRIQEARICLTRNLERRTCGRDTIRDCTMSNALFDPIR